MYIPGRKECQCLRRSANVYWDSSYRGVVQKRHFFNRHRKDLVRATLRGGDDWRETITQKQEKERHGGARAERERQTKRETEEETEILQRTSCKSQQKGLVYKKVEI